MTNSRLRLGVVVGNPRPGSRTLAAAVAVADILAEALGGERTTVLDLAVVRDRLFEPQSARSGGLIHEFRAFEVLLVVSPTYKATYTGLLKVYFDGFPAQGLAGTTAIPMMTAAAPIHALAVEVHLRPLLIELGASIPTAGIFMTEQQFADIPAAMAAWLAHAIPHLSIAAANHLHLADADGSHACRT